ncbi:unnamed protein product [Adineta ricciae]|uniref:F-box domain-containing protein n=1 Tax=Adineta ricciae TaxID=249248 RepID=A0A815PIY9_ADIRI|nr:unnamed protein product [Adineta ricciae]
MFTFELLPNELLHNILSYLHSDEIIYSFLNLNLRFYNLCVPYIERLNLSTTNNAQLWCTSNFQLVPSIVKTLKFNDTQLDWIFDSSDNVLVYFAHLKTIYMRILSQNDYYKCYLPTFKQKIYSLTMEYQNATLFSKVNHEILNEFINNDPSMTLNSLTIDGVCLSIDSEYFQICQTLKRLTLSVEYQHHLFILLEYLPQLEYLNIGIREGKAGRYDYDYSKTKYLSLKLQRLIMSANDIDFHDLNLLIQQCRTTLNVLKLHLKIDYIIDGQMLEAWKGSLKEFYFYFFCHSLGDAFVDPNTLLSSFQTSTWLRDQTVMFFTNSFYRTCAIVSPPSHCRSFNCSLTNEFLNYRVNNQYLQLTMPRIKRIFLNDKQQPVYTNRFFRVFGSIFVNLQILEIGSNFHLADNENQHDDLKLPTVRTLIIVTNQDYLNVQRLLKLLPNLSRLVIDYDLLVASTYDLSYTMENRNQLQEILIYFQPNQHVELDDELKNRVKFVYGNAKILC